MSTGQNAYLPFPDHVCMLVQPLHRRQLLIQKNHVPKSSSHHSSFVDQDTFELCKSHFCLSCNQQLGKLHISEELKQAYGHGLAANDPPKPYSPSVEHDHEKPRQGVDEDARIMPSFSIWVSIQHDACIPTSSDLNFVRCSLKPPFRDFKRSTKSGASLLFRERQTFVVPR